MWWQMLILHIIHLQIILIFNRCIDGSRYYHLDIEWLWKKNVCRYTGCNIFLYSRTCLWKSDVASLKINIFERSKTKRTALTVFEPFKDIDFKKNCGRFSETGESFFVTVFTHNVTFRTLYQTVHNAGTSRL